MKLAVSHAGYKPAEVVVPDVQADKETPVPDVVLEGDAALGGVVTDEDSRQPLRDVLVTLTAGGQQYKVRSDAKGAYALSRIRSGQPVTVEAAAEQYVGFREAKTLPSGNTELNIALARDATLAVHVIDAADPAKKPPVAGARVKIAGKGIDKEATSDATGRAVFEHIPARPVQIDVAADDYCPAKSDATPGGAAAAEVALSRAASLTLTAVCPLSEKNVPGLAKPLTLPVPDAAVTVAVTDKNGAVTKHAQQVLPDVLVFIDCRWRFGNQPENHDK